MKNQERNVMGSHAWRKGASRWLVLALVALAWGTTAWAGEQEESAGTAPLTPLSLKEAVICKGIENRSPLEPGETFGNSVGRLYCFTWVTGATGDTAIHHIWHPPNGSLHDQSLQVKSSSWRTWSYKTIPAGWTGQWHVDVTSEDGTVLKTLVFEVK